jgi:hypothetical protein
MELAYKFYLFDPSILLSESINNWITQIGNDFIREIRKIKTKYFVIP